MHADPSAAALSLRAQPDWHRAAQWLIDGCAHLPSAPLRIELLERLCNALGDELYPALLGVLCTVAERGTPQAQQAVAAALLEGLCSGRVPSGRRPAWGAPSARPDAHAMRRLGPVEYLCAWYAQPAGAAPPSAPAFDRALRSLLGMVSTAEPARLLYCDRLRAAADDPLSGTLARATRDALRRLAEAWESDGANPQVPVDAFLQALHGNGLGLQGLRQWPPVLAR
jgi:hypothetical protein